jgi:hypothetical protein
MKLAAWISAGFSPAEAVAVYGLNKRHVATALAWFRKEIWTADAL